MAWNNTYEASPRNTNNPGYGAQAIRELKVDIRERLERFNTWGEDEVTYSISGGTPKEGAARVTVEDDGTPRDDIVDATTGLPGQIVMDATELATKRTRDDVDLPLADDQLTKKLRLVIHDRVIDLFNYDTMVDIKQDQTIDGIKDFTLSPHVPDLGDWRVYNDAADKLEAAVNVKEAFENHVDSKYHNDLDAFNADNVTNNTLYQANGGYDNEAMINTNISVNEIQANAIRGAVWG